MKSLLLTSVMLTSICITTAYADFHDWAPTPPMGWNSYDYYGSINIRKGNGQYGNNYNQFGSNNGCGGCGGVNYPEPYNYFDF